MKVDINKFLLEKFKFKLVQKNDYWVEYTDGNKVLYVNSAFFEYYNKETREPVLVTADIQLLVDLIRSEVLNTDPLYSAKFSDYEIKKVVKLNERN